MFNFIIGFFVYLCENLRIIVEIGSYNDYLKFCFYIINDFF